MSEDKKAREFWIAGKKDEGRSFIAEPIVLEKPLPCDVAGGIHVIEYLAYEALQKELSEVRANFQSVLENMVPIESRQIVETANKFLIQQRDQLRNELEAEDTAHRKSLAEMDELRAEVERLEHEAWDGDKLAAELTAERAKNKKLLEALEPLINKFNPDKQAIYEFARKDIELARQAIGECGE